MTKKSIIKNLLITGLILANIGCDQVSKQVVRKEISSFETIPVIKNHFTLMKVENTGAFLSVGNTLPGLARTVLLSLLPVLVLGAAFVYLLRKHPLNPYTLTGLCFVIGGGIGNIFDRIVYGSVTDFMYIDLGIVRTGIFNMADLSIVSGTILLLLGALKKPVTNPVEKNEL